ncbi:amino acid adenylation domain-containing protein [Moorena producens JHB]|uniref:Amino acid adenylation domain-containing protein n=1 Tax=Moorena producens (strain JHB) TaxID=1454205 RepID=A0A9Q9SU57_MOOP1|nr:non-ribosomal peptide synthetase [Moorena producens]WAN69719.1 amino acid adenylation domain-containing protein [Moorena producens JHB]
MVKIIFLLLMIDINQRIAKLSPVKRKLLEHQLKQKLKNTNDKSTITPRENPQSIPLSFSEERMWILDRLEPGNPAYNRPTNIRLTGSLKVNALERAINEIVGRHEVFRTSFPAVDGQPIQAIAPNLTVKLLIIELSHLPSNERETEVKRIAVEEAQHRFDLSKLPLIQAKLLRLSQEENILLLTMHHIIFDGWSAGVLLKELAVHYEAFTTGKSSPLPPLPIQYADFAIWQRQRLQGERLESQLAYWKKQLGGSLPVLELPTDRPRRPVQTFQGAKQNLLLPQNLSDSLKELSLRAGVTLFMTLLAAFQILLYRYTGEEDIIVGTPIAGRDSIEIEQLIGVFINTLVLRTQLNGNFTFSELLAQVREVALGAYAHQDIPFEKLVEELQPERDLSHTPIFQVLFQLKNLPSQVVEVQGLRIDNCQLETGMAMLDLTLEIEEQSTGLSCLFKYNSDLFDATTIERMAGHFQVLLEGIVANPQQPVYQLPLLTETERHQLLVEWNDTATDYPQYQCIHQLFEEQVELTPDAVAVVFEDKHLTYRQLNNRANQLAHYLRSLGVVPEVLVGICVERSLEMVVGLLGILKAGGAYVPLDPNYPVERLTYMLADSQVPLLLVKQKLQSGFPEREAQVVCLDKDWSVISGYSKENLASLATSACLAYVIYTSGSTGRPKGVEIEHRSLINFAQASRTEYGINKSDRVLQFASISFDAAAEEIYPYLLSGGTLVLRTEQMLSSVSTFWQTCRQWGITVLDLPTAYWQQMMTELETAVKGVFPESVRLVIIGGERALPWLVKNWQKLMDEVPQLVNSYGPTEATVVTALHKIRASDTIQQEVPIGRAIANVQIYILDRHLQPVPIGVPGELYIGGVQLARGYLNRPELTQEKFIPSPFSNEPGSRLYKTGDLARYLRDGNIEFLGRIDNQVKIRGFRIELSEIEATLTEYPQVKEAVVIAREDIPGDKRLVAYFVSGETVPTVSELRSFLKKKLPDYMVPSAFVTLESLPLTPNGKIDRRGLPAPDISQASETTFVPPNTPTEELLGAIWSQVLGIEKIGIDHNFFELGGHSLKATQVISRIQETFSLEFPLRHLFESPTLRELAKIIETTGQTTWQIPEITPRAAESKLALSFAQERLWFLNQLEGESATYNLTSAWLLSGNLSLTCVEQAFNEIVHRHEIIRTRFTTENGVPIQVITVGKPIKIAVEDLQQISQTETTTEVERRALEEAQTPFNLATDSLVRVKILRLGSQSHVLMLTMHHIISDGWSMGLLWRELSLLYQAFSNGEHSPLAPLPIQYADFALWQREWFKGNLLETQLNYWKQQLKGVPPLLELPYDRPRPPIETFRGGRESFKLSAELTHKLHNLSQKSGCTLFMTLLAAWSSLLYRYSGQSDILVGTPIANRNRREIEPLMGFFVNTLVMRTQFPENISFAEVLKRVRQTAIEAYGHQDLPFEKLVQELKLQRSLSHNPLFQVMFALQNATMVSPEFPGLTFTKLEMEGVVAKFDLFLSMNETSVGLQGEWGYNSDLFDRATIRRWIGHFQVLLEGIIANPQQPVYQLPLLTETERHQLLVEWNNTATDYPKYKCIHQLFEEQVELTPDAVAVVFEDKHLTYRQLNNRANQLAHYLRSLGVVPEVLVGICVERSLEMVVGLLGILKAGGAYVPLDPAYPQERLTYILEDSQVSILVTQKHLIEQIPKIVPLVPRIVFLDSTDILDSCEHNNIQAKVNAKNLAYIIYTSGSTGKPKGVAVEHKGVVNYLHFRNLEMFKKDELRVVFLTTSIGFDASVPQLFSPLAIGGKVIVINNIDQLYTWLSKEKVTCISTVASLLEQLIKNSSLPSSLRVIALGGESVPQNLLQQLAEYENVEKVINMYGPTEASICACTGIIA